MTDPKILETEKQIAIERANQITVHGYDAAHDDERGIDHLIQIAYTHTVYHPDPVKVGAMLHAIQGYLVRERRFNKMQLDVEQFMNACEQEVGKYPQLIDSETRTLRESLMIEELHGSGELLESMKNEDLVGIADGIADLLYVILGTASAYGINVKPIFDEVHRSNMSKATWNDEEQRYLVTRREDGKILKPDAFSPPNIEAVLTEQTSINTSLLQ